MSASCTPSGFPSPCLLFFDCIQQGIGYPEVLYLTELNQHPTRLRDKKHAHCAASNITLFKFPKLIAIRISLIHFSQRDIHEVVAVDEMTIKSLAVLEFD